MFRIVKQLCGALLAIVTMLAATVVNATTITYTDTGIGSGSFGNITFTDALITLTGTGETANVVPFGTQFANVVFPLTIEVAGVGTATYNGGGPPFAFTNQTPGMTGAGFGGASTFVFGTFNSVFGAYDLTTAIGPVTGPGVFQNVLLTSEGDFTLTSLGETTFTATVESSSTPLPAALPLFASAFGGLGALYWRRKRKQAA